MFFFARWRRTKQPTDAKRRPSAYTAMFTTVPAMSEIASSHYPRFGGAASATSSNPYAAQDPYRVHNQEPGYQTAQYGYLQEQLAGFSFSVGA
jgi:hypothetical protein